MSVPHVFRLCRSSALVRMGLCRGRSPAPGRAAPKASTSRTSMWHSVGFLLFKPTLTRAHTWRCSLQLQHMYIQPIVHTVHGLPQIKPHWVFSVRGEQYRLLAAPILGQSKEGMLAGQDTGSPKHGRGMGVGYTSPLTCMVATPCYRAPEVGRLTLKITVHEHASIHQSASQVSTVRA